MSHITANTSLYGREPMSVERVRVQAEWSAVSGLIDQSDHASRFSADSVDVTIS